MAWLCVDKNGQELICQNKPERWGNFRKETTSPFDKLDRVTGKRYKMESSPNLKPEQLSYWKDEEILNMGEFYIDYTIDLPKGTINKITGKQLNWEDEPIEI